jgi:hypothetical protein
VALDSDICCLERANRTEKILYAVFKVILVTILLLKIRHGWCDLGMFSLPLRVGSHLAGIGRRVCKQDSAISRQ